MWARRLMHPHQWVLFPGWLRCQPRRGGFVTCLVERTRFRADEERLGDRARGRRRSPDGSADPPADREIDFIEGKAGAPEPARAS